MKLENMSKDSLVDIIKGTPDMMYALKHHKSALASGMRFRGDVKLEHYRAGKTLWNDWEPTSNLITTEGMARLLNVVFGTTTQDADLFINLFKGSVTPLIGHTKTQLATASQYQVCTHGASGDYDAADNSASSASTGNAPIYVCATTTTAVCTNAAAKAHFVMDAGITITGAYICNIETITGQVGGATTLIAAKEFETARAVVADDEIYVTYAITLVNT